MKDHARRVIGGSIASLVTVVAVGLMVATPHSAPMEGIHRAGGGRAATAFVCDSRPDLTVDLEASRAELDAITNLTVRVASNADHVSELALRLELPPGVKYSNTDVPVMGRAFSDLLRPRIQVLESGVTRVTVRDLIQAGESKGYDFGVLFSGEARLTCVRARVVRLRLDGRANLSSFQDSVRYFSIGKDQVGTPSASEVATLHRKRMEHELPFEEDESLRPVEPDAGVGLVSEPMPGVPIHEKVMTTVLDPAVTPEDPFVVPARLVESKARTLRLGTEPKGHRK